MGKRPPQLSGIKVYKNYNSSRSNEINIDLHISWFSGKIFKTTSNIVKSPWIKFSGLGNMCDKTSVIQKIQKWKK